MNCSCCIQTGLETFTNFFRLGVARDGRADDLVPDRPNAVFVETGSDGKALERLFEHLADAL